MPLPGQRLAVETSDLGKLFRPPARLRDLLRARLGGEPVRALDGVTLACAPGETLGLIGPNGAGKTTLLRVLAGLVLPSSGRATVLGQDVARAPASFRERVTYVAAEERTFSLRLTGRQNLRFFAALHGLRGRARDARAAQRLETVGLAGDADRPVAGYSTGMRARLALARGLLGTAEVLLLDEPTRGIDPWAGRGFRALLASLAREGRTLVVASHDLAGVRELCGRVAVLERGRLRGVAPPDEAAGLLDARA